MSKKIIPDIVVGRLPVYLRALQLLIANGVEVTSSQELSEQLGFSAAQIRKDLSQFGEFGKQGTGYNTTFLLDQLKKILNIVIVWDMVVVGFGHVGSGLAHYEGFEDRGFKVKYIFDNDPTKIGKKVGNYKILNPKEITKIVKDSRIKVAMISVPANQAQQVANKLIKAGIKAILNYAPINLSVPDGIQVQNIDPSIHLQHMTYYL